MADKQTILGTPFSHLERKLQQAFAKIAGRARLSIDTQTGISTTFDGTTQTIFSKTFKSGFFKSVGDSLAITIYGQLTIPAGKSGSFQIRISEDSAAIDPTEYIIRVPFTAGAATVDFTGFGRLILQDGDLIQGHGITLSEDTSPTIRSRRMPGPYTYNTEKLTITGLAIGDSGCTINIDLFQIEFIPAVISD